MLSLWLLALSALRLPTAVLDLPSEASRLSVAVGLLWARSPFLAAPLVGAWPFVEVRPFYRTTILCCSTALRKVDKPWNVELNLISDGVQGDFLTAFERSTAAIWPTVKELPPALRRYWRRQPRLPLCQRKLHKVLLLLGRFSDIWPPPFLRFAGWLQNIPVTSHIRMVVVRHTDCVSTVDPAFSAGDNAATRYVVGNFEKHREDAWTMRYTSNDGKSDKKFGWWEKHDEQLFDSLFSLDVCWKTEWM